MTNHHDANHRPKLSPSAETYQNAEQTFRIIEGKLIGVLNDALHVNDELLDAYKQARNNLNEALEALIKEQNLNGKD